MRDVVVCSPVRTPVGRYGGAHRDVGAAELAATVIRAQVDRTGIETAEASDAIIAGGAESMSGVEYYADDLRWGRPGAQITFVDRLARARVTAGGKDHPVPGGMLETAENVRAEYGIGREEQDELALRSHQRAVAAQEAGRFADEIVPVRVTDRTGTRVVARDEHPRADTSLERLAGLRPVMGVDGATVTAGNSSGQNDGAAACLVSTRARADALGLTPQAHE